jgi:hypothetical protein
MRGRLTRCELLSAAQREGMYQLLAAHFEGVSPEGFQADLAEKNWAVLLEDESGRLRGFSTLLVYRTCAPGREVGVACSGDTIVDPASWGSGELLRTWLDAVLSLGRRLGTGEFYWLLISSGYRTYRFLPVFWREFYPRFDDPTPPDVRALTDALARERWGRSYDPESGLVRFTRPQVLRADISPLSSRRLRDPHVAFFLRSNPGHVRGDELVCLTRIRPENLSRAGRRVLHEVRASEPARAEASA